MTLVHINCIIKRYEEKKKKKEKGKLKILNINIYDPYIYPKSNQLTSTSKKIKINHLTWYKPNKTASKKFADEFIHLQHNTVAAF